jgi:hypothetical protein
MKLTKYAHACVALEKNGSRILLDPGTFTPEAKDALTGAAAVLITHEHFDHFDHALLAAALETDPDLRVFGPGTVLDKLGGHSGRVRALTAGDTLDVDGFTVTVHGGRVPARGQARPGDPDPRTHAQRPGPGLHPHHPGRSDRHRDHPPRRRPEHRSVSTGDRGQKGVEHAFRHYQAR